MLLYFKRYRVYVEFLAYLTLSLWFSLWVPMTISYDGYGYLSSGKSLFSTDFPEWYHLLREPGYPFLIWICSKFENPLAVLSVLQSTFLSISSILLVQIARKYFNVQNLHSFVIGLIGLMCVRGYASGVLQQSAIILNVTLAVFITFRMIQNEQSKFNLNPILLVFGFLSAALNTASMFAIFCGFGIAILTSLRNSKGIKFLLSFSVGVSMLVIPWNVFTSTVDMDKQVIPSYRNGISIDYFTNTTMFGRTEQRIGAFGSLISIGPEVYSGLDPNRASIGFEAWLYGSPTNYNTWPNCVRAMEGQKEITSKVADLIDSRCISKRILDIQSYTSYLVIWLIPLSGYAFLFLIGLMFFKWDRRLMNLLTIPTLLILAYAYKGGGVSRYGSIIPFFGAFFLYLIVREIFSKENKFKPKNLTRMLNKYIN
jgi:hypothetical protein